MLIIDSDNYAKAGIETMFFSDGQPHAKVPPLTGSVVLFLKLRTWADVGLATAVTAAVDASGASKVVVFIPYFPGARQDKVSQPPLMARIMGRLFHADAVELVTFDIHSEAAFIFSEAHRNLMPSHLDIPTKSDVVGIIAPDKGAVQRATEFRDAFYPGAIVLECSKKRNALTGELSDYHMPALERAGRYIIVDDICDGGRTFNLLAEAFVNDPAYQATSYALELFVSHGIFSRGISNLHPAIEHITTTDSFAKESDYHPESTYLVASRDRITIVPLLPYLLAEEEK